MTTNHDHRNGLLRGEPSADRKLMIREGLLPPVIEPVASLEKHEHAA